MLLKLVLLQCCIVSIVHSWRPYRPTGAAGGLNGATAGGSSTAINFGPGHSNSQANSLALQNALAQAMGRPQNGQFHRPYRPLPYLNDMGGSSNPMSGNGPGLNPYGQNSPYVNGHGLGPGVIPYGQNCPIGGVSDSFSGGGGGAEYNDYLGSNGGGYPGMGGIPGLGSGIPGLGSGIPGLGSGIPGLGSGIPGLGGGIPGLDGGMPGQGGGMPGIGALQSLGGLGSLGQLLGGSLGRPGAGGSLGPNLGGIGGGIPGLEGGYPGYGDDTGGASSIQNSLAGNYGPGSASSIGQSGAINYGAGLPGQYSGSPYGSPMGGDQNYMGGSYPGDPMNDLGGGGQSLQGYLPSNRKRQRKLMTPSNGKPCEDINCVINREKQSANTTHSIKEE